jgi:prophage regulatory protein
VPERFISMDEVIDRVSFSKTHIYRKIAEGTFPRPIPLGRHKVAFLECEIESWINARIEERDIDVSARSARARAIAMQRKGPLSRPDASSDDI